jgi:F-type H+-transporting ATPase subunit b
MDLLTPDGGTLFWTALTFLTLVFLLKKMAWKPLLKALDEREQRMQEQLQKTEEARRDAERKLAEYQAMLDNARNEAQEVINKGRKSAEATKDEIVRKAQTDADQIVERAKREISLEREKAIGEIKKTAGELSLAIATKIIKKSLNPKDHQDLIHDAVSDFASGLKGEPN